MLQRQRRALRSLQQQIAMPADSRVWLAAAAFD